MESIKEKAEEVFPIKEHDSLETELQRRKMRLCYEHGANYVLKEIEHFAESTWGASSLNTISLKKMIKELKGE